MRVPGASRSSSQAIIAATSSTTETATVIPGMTIMCRRRRSFAR
jgi:hypothetical protein